MPRRSTRTSVRPVSNASQKRLHSAPETETCIVASSRSQARARAARHDDGGDHGAEFAELCDDDELGDVHYRAEPPELRDAEKSDDEPDKQVRGGRDRQCVRADRLHQTWQR